MLLGFESLVLSVLVLVVAINIKVRYPSKNIFLAKEYWHFNGISVLLMISRFSLGMTMD